MVPTADFKYVDHEMLKMPKESFDRVLKDLVEYGVLEENENDNMYGANHYDIALKYIEIKNNKKRKNVRGLKLVKETYRNSNK